MRASLRGNLEVGVQAVVSLLPRRADFTAMRRNPKRDIIAGVTVAFVALPLALAFGAASGVGAGAGITTAIVAGILAALFGGSNLQVSGPTGAMTVVLLPIYAEFGVTGILTTGFIAGLILICWAFMSVGKAMQYVPLPVIEGFTLGIAVIIGLQQVPYALGTTPTGEKIIVSAWNACVDFITSPHWVALGITVFVAGAILVGVHFRPGMPLSLPAVLVVTIFVAYFGLTVNSIGQIPQGLPAPSFGFLDTDRLSPLLLSAIAVAALAALESLLSASVADAMSVNQRHDPNRELFGQGIANVVTPFFGGVPATAAIARTAVNVRSGAQSRLAAIVQSVVLLIVILIAAQWVAYIPLAALAGVLIATVVQMVEVSSLRALVKATRGDAVILIATAIATIVFDLVTAVLVGLVIAAIYALRQMAKSIRVSETTFEPGDFSDQELELLDNQVIVYRIDGPLFFGGAHKFLLEMSEISHIKVVILRLSRVSALDATGASVLGDTIKTLEGKGITVLLSGIQSNHDSVFKVLGIYRHLSNAGHVFPDTPSAIQHALGLVAKIQ